MNARVAVPESATSDAGRIAESIECKSTSATHRVGQRSPGAGRGHERVCALALGRVRAYTSAWPWVEIEKMRRDAK